MHTESSTLLQSIGDTPGTLEFVDSSAVLPPDGMPLHPRLAEDVKRKELVYAHDAASCRGPQLPSNDCEFILGGLGQEVEGILREATGNNTGNVELLRQDLFGAGLKTADAHPAEAQPGSVEKVNEHLAKRSGLSAAISTLLAKALSWRSVELQSGSLFILACVPVGIGRRVVWPSNAHPKHTGQAASVHTDQDIDGDPMASKGKLLRWLLAHKWLRILNLWMPAGDMAVRPLCVMDTKSLDPGHAVRHRWLDHDGWKHLHDPEQIWWWHSKLGQQLGDAIIFDTLRSPHGALAFVCEEELHKVREDLLSRYQKDSPSCAEGCNADIERLQSAHNRVETALAQGQDWPPSVRRALHAAQTELQEGIKLLGSAMTSADNVIIRAVGHLQRQSVEARVIAIGPTGCGACLGWLLSCLPCRHLVVEFIHSRW